MGLYADFGEAGEKPERVIPGKSVGSEVGAGGAETAQAERVSSALGFITPATLWPGKSLDADIFLCLLTFLAQ